MGYLIMAGQLILSLSILIVLHEFGHFAPARWFKTRVEKFYLFFDPWFALFKFKRGDTEYGIGWLPLGGYVKISGMVDESFDSEQLKGEPQPWEFRSKPAWQRLIIMLGGVTVNFLLGMFIFAMIFWHYGEEFLPNSEVKFGIAADSLGMDLGLKDGDKVMAVGAKPFTKFDERIILREIVINNAKTIKIDREGQTMNLPVDEKFVGILSSHKNKNKSLFAPRFPFVIKEVVKGSPAAEAGLKANDKILTFNGKPSLYYHEFVRLARGSKNKKADLVVLRSQDTLNLGIHISKEGTVGVATVPPVTYFKTKRQEYTLVQAFPAGAKKGWNLLSDQIKAFGQIFRGKIKASESLGGFGSIASMYGVEWIWERFWTMTAILSLILAFMNLLPIPALDGGHVVFLLYELVSGRKPSDKFMEYATVAGFVIVIGLVLFANGMDVIRAIFNK
jgi:regulator of sigma E protease